MIIQKEYKRLQKALDEIDKWASDNFHTEICGFLGYNETSKNYIITLENNCSIQPQHFFAIDALSYLLFKQKNSLIAVFHSHIIGGVEHSEFDIKMSENCCIPFMIFSINSNKFHFYEPQNKEYDVKVVSRFKEKIK